MRPRAYPNFDASRGQNAEEKLDELKAALQQANAKLELFAEREATETNTLKAESKETQRQLELSQLKCTNLEKLLSDHQQQAAKDAQRLDQKVRKLTNNLHRLEQEFATKQDEWRGREATMAKVC